MDSVKEQTSPEEKNAKQSYSEPTLEKREKLVDITEGLASPSPVST